MGQKCHLSMLSKLAKHLRDSFVEHLELNSIEERLEVHLEQQQPVCGSDQVRVTLPPLHQHQMTSTNMLNDSVNTTFFHSAAKNK